MDPNSAPEITAELLQENPTLMLVWTAFTFFFFALIAGGITSWVWVGIRWWKNQDLLVPENWTPRTWGLVDLLVCMLLLFALQSFVYVTARSTFGIDLQNLEPGQLEALELSALSSCGLIATALLTVLWIVLRHQTTFAHVGITTKRTGRYLFWGLVVGLCTLPVVYAISAAVTLGLDKKYEHPILDQMAENGSLASYLLAAFAAVIAAPIAEEFFFRVFVQGWMQSIPFSSLPAIVLGASKHRRSDPETEFFHPSSTGSFSVGPVTAGAIASAHEGVANPYATEAVAPSGAVETSEANETTSSGDESHPGIVPPIWPSVITGILFGLAHLDYGYSFVPLIVFGFVLGLLYRATQSVWPCILVHMMLNATSIITLGVSVYAKQVIGE